MESVRSWVDAAWELTWGMLKRFYLWVIPLLVLQPIDVLDRLGIPLSIPDEVLYALMGAGVFVSAVDVLRSNRIRLLDAELREDARQIVGTVEMTPHLMPMPAKPDFAVLVRPILRLENKGASPVLYLGQRFDVRIRFYSKVFAASSESAETGEYDDDTASITDPTSVYTIPPGAYVDLGGPGTFGPYGGMGNPLDVTYEIELRFARAFATSTVIEHRTFSFRAYLFSARDQMEGRGEFGATVPNFSAEQGAPRYLRAGIVETAGRKS